MPNTYTQIYFHVIFAVRFREALIAPEWKERLYNYIIAIVQNKGHKILAVGGTSNHIHLLIGMKPDESLSSLVLVIKRDSSQWINKAALTSHPFRWQEGFGAFTYHRSLLPTVINYIQNQESHHATKSFRNEVVEILNNEGVEYDERYLSDDVGTTE